MSVACGSRPSVAQAPKADGEVQQRFAQFLADYWPKAQRLHRHVFFEVVSQSTHAQFVEDDDPSKPDRRVLVHSTSYQADATRFVRLSDFLHGETCVTIPRPDVNSLLLKEKGARFRLTYHWDSPGDDWKECFTRRRHQFDQREFEPLGIGLMYRSENRSAILAKDGIIVTDVQSHQGGALDAAAVSCHFPPHPDRYEFSFHTDIGISYRQVVRMERGVNTSVVECACPGRVIENFVPMRSSAAGASLARPMASKLTDEQTVEEFRKQSRFDDAVFRTEQFGLTDTAATPPMG